MKKVLFVCAFLACYLTVVSQDKEVNFSVKVSTDSVLLGNYIEVKFILENANISDFSPPEFEGFKLVSGPNQSSNFSMVNGKVTQSTAYTYYLEPDDIGNYFIQPASVDTGERILETMPVEIMVYPNPDGIIQNQKQPNRDDFFGNFFDRQDDFFNRRNDLFSQPRIKKDTLKPKKKRKVYKL